MMSSSFNQENFAIEYRSTKGASKQRRENINNEIGLLRDLLPLPESSRKKLSQLQVMVLSKTYIEMANSFTDLSNVGLFDVNFALQALPGFLILLSTNGTILYISDNSTDYIGHSMVDIVSQCESMYEHMHEGDRPLFKSLLSSANQMSYFVLAANKSKLSITFRFGLMKHIRRNNSFDRYKILQMSGRFMKTENGSCVFVGLCSPQFDATHPQSQLDTRIFATTHNLDMTIVNVDDIAEHYLDASKYAMTGGSMYEFIHPRDVAIFAAKHKELLHSEGTATALVRLVARGDGSELNVQTTMKYVVDTGVGLPLILCYHQVVESNAGQTSKGCAAAAAAAEYGLVQPKVEVEADCKLDRADILRRLKNKMDRKNSTKRKALAADPPPYTAAIAPKILKTQNLQPKQQQQPAVNLNTFVLDLVPSSHSPSSSVMYGSPGSVTSDYHAVAPQSDPEEVFHDELSFHRTNEIKMPVLDHLEIEDFFEILESKSTEFIPFSDYQLGNLSDFLSHADWLNSNIESFVSQSNLFNNLIPAIF